MSDEIEMLDVADAQLKTLLSELPAGDPVLWVEDELHPYTAEDRLRDARYVWLLDNHGPKVARLWMDLGYPIPLNWTEIIRTPVDG